MERIIRDDKVIETLFPPIYTVLNTYTDLESYLHNNELEQKIS